MDQMNKNKYRTELRIKQRDQVVFIRDRYKSNDYKERKIGFHIPVTG